MGIKNQKGTVSIENYKNRIRLRWRYGGKRYSLSLAAYNKANLAITKKVALQIELDMISGSFDESLVKYGAKAPQPKSVEYKNLVEYFEGWVLDYKQLDCNVNSDYYHLRNTLRKWGEIRSSEILTRLNKENYSAKTYNERLAMLKAFATWMVQQGIWDNNPLIGVSRRRVKKIEKPERLPFSEAEIKLILEAIKNDQFCPKSSRYKHSHYYPFIYFLFKTGVRPAEAIGLRVECIDFKKEQITIKEVMARSVKGTNAAQRIRKETKNGKVRLLPLSQDLKDVLLPFCTNKHPDDLVFQSFNGQCIDDRMFQRRVFRVVLKELGIQERVLYACRHTFGSRCIDAGMTPVMTAFLMGNNPETALKNYVHQISMPKDLPNI
jgi:integrase